MASPQPTLEQLQRAYDMQKKAREHAEALLEEKSRELYLKNRSLQEALEKVNSQQQMLVTHEKLASVGQLGASMAHELNNPNAFIQNNIVTLEDYVQRLADGLEQALTLAETCNASEDLNATPEASRADRDKQIAQIRQQSDLDYIREDMPTLMKESLEGTQRINAIANSLRFFANPDLSTMRPLDISECIENAKQLVRSGDRITRVEVECEEFGSIEGLPLLLSQAIANLIQNAIDAQGEESIVKVCAYRNASDIVIDVNDSGPGIDEAAKHRIFDAFQSNKPGHNGLGLGMAKHIVEQHQGTLTLSNAEQGGALAQIRIPMKTDSQV